MTELLANIKNDIEEDGTLDNKDIIYDLKLNAELLKINNIEKNLANKYNLDFVPDFQKMINYYLDNSEVETNLKLTVPAYTDLGVNLLSIANGKSLNKDSSYCIAAEIHFVHPKDTVHFQISIEKENTVTWDYTDGHSLYETFDGWRYRVHNNHFECYLIELDRICVLPFEFSGAGKVTIKIDITINNIGDTRISRELYLE